MFFTSTPLSSLTSRKTASSRLSPGSTKPAKVEYIPSGQEDCRPRRQQSPLCTNMIVAGSVRGKCFVAQLGLVQPITCPASSGKVGLPQRLQNLCSPCQCVNERE